MFILEVIIISTILFYFKVKCPVGCAYCFEKPTDIFEYDLKKMIQTFRKIYVDGDQICLHGGEVCTLPISDLEYTLKEIRNHIKNNDQSISLQTSLYGMTDEHIEIFKKYNIGLGISIDGPSELNILRGPRDKKLNEKYQKDLEENLRKLHKNNIKHGSISVLSTVNASPDKIDSLINWAKEVNFEGRFNPMFIPEWNNNLKQYQLTPEEVTKAWLKLGEECINDKNLNWQPFREFIDNLMGTFHLSPCIISRCDYLTTTCETIMGDGSLARCDRCFQEGYYGRGKDKNFIRSEALKNTECEGCKYFEICGGGCPGESIEGDPRHKSYYCDAYYKTYEMLENKLRGLMPNILLSIDISDFFEKYDQKNRKLDFFRNFDNGTWRESKKKNCNCEEGKKDWINNNIPRPHGDHYDENHYNNIKAKDHGDHYDN